MFINDKVKWLFDTPIAHRGLYNDSIAENSMSAFKAAIDKGFNIEVDVHMSADGKVLVFHDYDLNRVCGENIKTIDILSSELYKYKLSNTHDNIITLEQLLQLIDGKVGLLIEIKSKFYKAYNNISSEVYKEIKDYKGNVAIQSFSYKVVRWFTCNAPDVPRGIIASAYENIYFPKYLREPMKILNSFIGLRFIKSINPDFIAYNILSFPRPIVQRHRNSGIPILTWTVNKMEHISIAKEWADNIIFEKIDINNF